MSLVQYKRSGKFNEDQLTTLGICIEDGLDPTPFALPQIPDGLMWILREVAMKGTDLTELDLSSFGETELHVVVALMADEILSVERVNRLKGFRALQIEECARGFEAGVDESLFMNKYFPAGKMWFNIVCAKKGISLTLNGRDDWTSDEYYEFSEWVEAGYDLEANLAGCRSVDDLRMKRLYLEFPERAGIFGPYYKYSFEQYSIIIELVKSNYTDEVLKLFADPSLNNNQMREMLSGLKSGVDISLYATKGMYFRFDDKQMREIRMGLEQGLDVTKYNNNGMFPHPWQQMKMIREQLLEEQSLRKSNSF